jgi:DNA-binding XRE family transcriptional regulator
MPYKLDEIAANLRQARQAKGLTQRALSAKVGLTQAHISKIENAAVDLQLSNLIDLARALDLEVMLVPRKAIPATQGVIRATTPTSQALPSGEKNVVNRLESTIGQFATVLSDRTHIEQLQKIADASKSFGVTAEQAKTLQQAAHDFQRISETVKNIKLPTIEKLSLPNDYARQLNELAKQAQTVQRTAREFKNIHGLIQNIKLPQIETLTLPIPRDYTHQLATLTKETQQLKNVLASRHPTSSVKPALPAYRLDDDEGTDG